MTAEKDWGVEDKDLATGKTYSVDMADCCVCGSFTAELVTITMTASGNFILSLQFANGVELTETRGCVFKEVALQ